MELLDGEMDQSEEMAQFWTPDHQDDMLRLQMSNSYIDLNKKLRAKIGDLLEGLENAMRKNQERRELSRPIYGVQRSNSLGAVTEDKELAERDAQLNRQQGVILR